MNKETQQEILKVVNDAASGNWIPLITLSILMAMILSLLIYIWNMHQKKNEKKHNATDKVLEKLTEGHLESLLILERVTAKMEGQDGRIKKVEGEIKELRS